MPLFYISGFVVRKIQKKLSCEVCRAVTAAVTSSFDQSSHLLELKNNGGLMIPSQGTVKVVKQKDQILFWYFLEYFPLHFFVYDF